MLKPSCTPFKKYQSYGNHSWTILAFGTNTNTNTIHTAKNNNSNTIPIPIQYQFK
jgi:hypothetical protein